MKTDIVLFAEDDSHMALSLANNLVYPIRQAGFRLLVFTDAEAALNTIRDTAHFNIAAAIIDLWMIDKKTGSENEEKGQELINIIKERHPNANILVLSSHITERDKEAFERTGKVIAIRKPASSNEIFEALRLHPNISS